MSGDELKKKRRAKKLSRKELGEKAKIPWRSIEHYEQGRPIPPSKAMLLEIVLKK